MGSVTMDRNLCPVCGYPDLQDPPRATPGGASYEICPSCGFEFGVSDDDVGYSYEEWRLEWVTDGMPWRSTRPRPAGWDPADQIRAVRET